MEPLAAVLALILTALAAFLSVLAGLATRRFGERRFLLVGLAFALVAVFAALGLIAELGVLPIPWYDEAFALEPVPLALLIAALLLVYAAMASPRRRENGNHARGG
jgi:MFS family permease